MPSLPQILATAVLVFGAGGESVALMDSNGGLVSDLWAARFGAVGLAPGLDSDGDGVSEWEELVAGFNPHRVNTEVLGTRNA